VLKDFKLFGAISASLEAADHGGSITAMLAMLAMHQLRSRPWMSESHLLQGGFPTEAANHRLDCG